jgi:biopolymer transport protein ExbB
MMSLVAACGVGLAQTSGDAPRIPQTLAQTGRPFPMMHDLSPLSMFMNADFVVKGVMIALALASIATWTVFLGKLLEIGVVGRRLRAAIDSVSRSLSVDAARCDLPVKTTALSRLLDAAAHERELSASPSAFGAVDRANSSFGEIVKEEVTTVRRGVGLLATIGATAPFVGLFGTVWGIMNSFIGISRAQTTNLAVVAPGIAEALLATAIGLVAAIPAVVFYNHITRATKSYTDLLARAAGLAERLLSRDIERACSGKRAR